ncbi:MAG: DUF975 family protein [Saccharofermentanales bacterium]|jgi:uncharacterized membrane protein
MTTKEIKSRAKNALKEGSYWSGYGVNITTGFINSIIETILGIFFSFGMFGSIFNLAAKATLTTILTDVEATFNLLQSFLNQIKVLFLSGLILSLLLFVAKLLLTNVLTAGKLLWFSRNREQAAAPAFSLLFNGFKKGSYGDLVKGMAWRDLWQIIWQIPIYIVQTINLIYSFVILERMLEVLRENQFYLSSYNLENKIIYEMMDDLIVLLIIMIVATIISIGFGIVAVIKQYSYRATAWILADNPNIGHRRALQLSKEMTEGFKGKWFVLDLSFIGWYLLLILTAPVMLFTAPLLENYTNASHAEFYAWLRDQAVGKGLVTMEELGYVAVQNDPYQSPVSATQFYQTQEQFGQPVQKVQPDNSAQSEIPVQPDTTVQPDTAVQSDTTVQPDDIVQPDKMIQPDNLEQEPDLNDNN